MNETVNKFLLVGDKFIPEIQLIQPSACGPFTKKKKKKKKEYKNLKKQEIHDIFPKTN